MDPAVIQKIVAATTKKVEEMRQMVQVPIILTSPIVRVYYKKMLDQFCPNVVVLSFNDVDPSVQIQSLGIIAL